MFKCTYLYKNVVFNNKKCIMEAQIIIKHSTR